MLRILAYCSLLGSLLFGQPMSQEIPPTPNPPTVTRIVGPNGRLAFQISFTPWTGGSNRETSIFEYGPNGNGPTVVTSSPFVMEVPEDATVNRRYSFAVRYKDTVSENTADSTTVGPIILNFKPPTSLNISQSSGNTVVNWTAPTGAVGYRIHQSNNPRYDSSYYYPDQGYFTGTSHTFEGGSLRYIWLYAFAGDTIEPYQISWPTAIYDSVTGLPVTTGKPPYQGACPIYPSGGCGGLNPSATALAATPCGGPGPLSGDPVNLRSGTETYGPAPDLVTYNKNGAPAVWARQYLSALAINEQCSPGLSIGWTHGFDATIVPSIGSGWNALSLRYPNGSMETITPTLASGVPTGAFVVPAAAPYIVTGQASSTQGQWNWIDIKFKDESRWRFLPHSGSGRYVLSYLYNRLNKGILVSYDTSRRVTLVRDALSLEYLMAMTYVDGLLDRVADYTDGSGGSRTLFRRIYYRRDTYADEGPDPCPGTHHSGVSVVVDINTSSGSAADRHRYTYTGRERKPHLSTISVINPSNPNGTRSTAQILYKEEQTGDGVYPPRQSAVFPVTELIDGNGNRTIFDYATATSTTVTKKNSNGIIELTYTQKFDSLGRNTGTIDAASNETTIAYGEQGTATQWLPITLTDAKGRQTVNTYDSFGNLETVTSPRSVVTTFDYSYSQFALGRLASIQVASRPATSFGYDATTGLLTSVTSPKPGGIGGTVTTTYAYDTIGNITSVTTPGNDSVSSMTTSLDYASDGNGYSQTPKFGQPLRITDSGGKARTFRYDNEGNLIWTKDELGKQTDFTVNLVGQILTVQVPATGQQGSGRMKTTSTYQYTGGPLASVEIRDESNAQVKFEQPRYGLEGELLSVNGSDDPSETVYNSLYRVKSIAGGLGQVTTYTYNSRGLPESISYPTSGTVQFNSYDANGNLLTATDENGLVTEYEYDDPEDQLTAITYPSLTGKDVEFTYDSYGRLSTKADKAGSYVWTYGDLDEVLTEATTYTGMSAKTLTYGYYLNGSRASVNLTGAGTIEYSYDAAGQLAELDEPYGTTASWTYRDDGLPDTQTLGNGAHTSYSYNDLGQITSLVNKASSGGTILSSFALGVRDGRGNLSGLTSTIPGATSYQGTTSWTYDSRSRLTQEASARLGSYTQPFDYDAAGNTTKLRSTSVNRSHNNRNQITNTGHTFNSNGNPTTYRTYAATWDENDRLLSYGSLLSMEYRSDGLRSQKGTGSSIRYFLYDGDTLLAEMNQWGTITAFNVFGPTGLLARRSGSATTFYQFDPLGGTVHRLDASGGVLTNHMQDAFGQPTSSGATSDPYLGRGAQAGYYRDSETGLYLCTNRFYDPVNARFLNRDPIGYAGGMNLYAYCGGNPIGRLDPLGFDGMWYDTLSAWVSDKVAIAKQFYYERTHWIVGGTLGTAMDFVTGVAHLPSAIGHLGEGLGCWAGSPNDPSAQIAAWGDVQTILSLGLMAAGPSAVKSKAPAYESTTTTYKSAAPTYEQLLPAAQKQYPKLAGKIQQHHVDPKYMGGAKDGTKVGIDAAYHQLITNEFRALAPYGQKRAYTPEERAAIMNQVYGKYPLPK